MHFCPNLRASECSNLKDFKIGAFINISDLLSQPDNELLPRSYNSKQSAYIEAQQTWNVSICLPEQVFLINVFTQKRVSYN